MITKRRAIANAKYCAISIINMRDAENKANSLYKSINVNNYCDRFSKAAFANALAIKEANQ